MEKKNSQSLFHNKKWINQFVFQDQFQLGYFLLRNSDLIFVKFYLELLKGDFQLCHHKEWGFYQIVENQNM